MSLPTVLVVDPSPNSARTISSALQGRAWNVVSARSADAALDAARGHDIGLVVVAASLPGTNGYEFAANAREQWPAASTILLTGGFEVYNRRKADEAGVAAHLTKPLQEGRYLEAMQGITGALAPMAAPVEQAPAPAPAPVLTAPPAPPAPPPPVVAPPPVIPVRTAAPMAPVEPPRPPISNERLATFLPRDYTDVPPVRVDPEVVGPAVERAILEVLPEVVEAVLRHALGSSTAFRDLVAAAVDEAVRESLPDIATKVVRERLAQLEARADSSQ